MPSPVLRGKTSSVEATNVLSHDVALPTDNGGIQEGDAIVVLIATDGSGASNIQIPAGWDQPDTWTDENHSGGCNFGCRFKIAGVGDVGATTQVFTTSSSERSAHQSFVYEAGTFDPDGFAAGIFLEAARAEHASGTLPDPPSLTPAFNRPCDLIAAYGADERVATTAGPTGYSDFVFVESDTGVESCSIGTARRSTTLSGAENPDAFTAGGGFAQESISATIIVYGLPDGGPVGGNGLLTWAPPTLVSPITLTPGTGNTYQVLDNQQDYIIDMPASLKTGQMMYEGGRNIVLIGGAMANYVGGGAALVYFTDNGSNGAAVPGRVIHIEGLDIDMSIGDPRDAYGVQTPSAIFRRQNCRTMGVRGTGAGVHGDVCQPYSAVKRVQVDMETASTDYQGYYIPPNNGVIADGLMIKRANYTLTFNGVDTTTQVLFLTNAGGAAAATTPTTLQDVYIDNQKASQDAQDAVYPDSSTTPPSVYATGIVSFPGHPLINGFVFNGAPPGGDYVPAGVAGLSYASPGYREWTPNPMRAPAGMFDPDLNSRAWW